MNTSILKTALLGTRKHPFQWQGLSETVQDASLLEHAALEDLRMRAAGHLKPLGSQMSGNEFSAEPEKYCEPSPAINLLISELLEFHMIPFAKQHLLVEMGMLLQEKQQRFPHRLLPKLLDMGLEFQALIGADVWGTHAEYLCGLNPKWATQNLTVTDWEEGSTSVRRQFLQKERNHHPQAALELLKSVWKKEKPKTRVVFLEALAPVHPSDEPWLEEVLLGDRSQEVRYMAAHHLSCIPGSAFSERMFKRAVEILDFRPQAAGHNAYFDLKLPATLPKDWAQDGIRETSPIHSLGHKAYWAQSVLENVDPGRLEKHFGCSTELYLECIQQSPWKEALVNAFKMGLKKYPDPDRISLRLEKIDRNVSLELLEYSDLLEYSELLEYLPPTSLQRELMRCLSKDISFRWAEDVQKLREFDLWGAEMQQCVLHSLERRIASGAHEFTYSPLLRLGALKANPEDWLSFCQTVRQNHPKLDVNLMEHIAQLRSDFRKELK
ncbi:MAG: DUF5691 domain-containing protein [Deinococcaceae bacterium]